MVRKIARLLPPSTPKKGTKTQVVKAEPEQVGPAVAPDQTQTASVVPEGVWYTTTRMSYIHKRASSG